MGLTPLPRGKSGSGKKDSWKEGASKPPVAQRAGGILQGRIKVGVPEGAVIGMGHLI